MSTGPKATFNFNAPPFFVHFLGDRECISYKKRKRGGDTKDKMCVLGIKEIYENTAFKIKNRASN